jgi:thiamine-monophosphate kinase
VVLGVGDDAAAWTPPAGHSVVLSVDAQVEGTHFAPGWLTPAEIGRRAVLVAASDLAAMAAEPAGVLASLVLPATLDEASFRELFRGIVDGAGACDLAVLGGNLARGPLSLSITAIGSAPAGALRTRAGARHGDVVFVSGHPGRAALGRALLAAGRRPATAPEELARAAFAAPAPRLRAALALAREVEIHALIDLSDGLGPDLGHVLEAASPTLEARLDGARLHALLDAPGHDGPRGMRALAVALDLDPLETVLGGGEDYEVLFTAPPACEDAVMRHAAAARCPVRRIGTLAEGAGGVWVTGSGRRPRRWSGEGFDHFSRGVT